MATSRSGGWAAQASSAQSQRGANAQPAPSPIMAGGEPGMGRRRWPTSSMRGMDASRPCVYGIDGLPKIRPTGPCSATSPAYITRTSSATPATTPRSWVMSRMAAPVSARSVPISSSSCA